MKYTLKCSLLMGALMLFLGIHSVFSQQPPFSHLQIYFYTQEDNIILNVNNDGTKKMIFQVKGLKDDEAATQFMALLKLYKGIYDIQISALLPNQTRQVTAICHPGYTLNNVKVVFGEVLKIRELFVNDEKIETVNIEQNYQ